MGKKLWKPSLDLSYSNLDSHSWFNIKQYSNILADKPKQYVDYNGDKITRTIKVPFYPTNEQKNILQKWFNDVIVIYNKTNQYIKSKIYDTDGNLIKDNFKLVNFYDIRNNEMTTIKEELNDESKINKHILDEAIHLNVTMYKSALSNLKAKNIKMFRIRDLNINKRRKNLYVESNLISKTKNGFCTSILGEIKCDYDLHQIDKTFIVQYDKYHNKYYLLIPKDIIKVENRLEEHIRNKNYRKVINNAENRLKTKNKCGIDPGVRTFLTVYSKDKVHEIGTNINETLNKYYNKIDKLNERKSKSKIKNKDYKNAITHVYDKITNKISDMHWKVSRYLCLTYDTIKIGKISTSKIVLNETSNINEKTKRVLMSLAHYRFRMRLKCQCEKYNIKYVEVDEYKTTKQCSECKEENIVGDKKIYECINCNLRIDRDINASINIYNKL